MPTVKFELGKEEHKIAKRIADDLNLTWREATLTGLGIMVKPRQVGRPKRLKLTKETKEELENKIKTIAIEAFHEALVGRDILPVVNSDDSYQTRATYYAEADHPRLTDDTPIYTEKHVVIPILDKSFCVFKEGQLNVDDIKNVAQAIAAEEDKLFLTGQHIGWPALGIEGLATTTGRNIVASSGHWPINIFKDIAQAKKHFNSEELIVLVVSSEIRAALNEVFWEDVEHLKPPMTYANFLLDQKLIGAIYESDNLFTADGVQDSALMFAPSMENAYFLQSMSLTASIWKDEETQKMKGYLREAVTPIITRPKSITEITGVCTLKRDPTIPDQKVMSESEWEEFWQKLTRVMGEDDLLTWLEQVKNTFETTGDFDPLILGILKRVCEKEKVSLESVEGESE